VIGHVIQQRRLAHTRLAAHDQCPALTSPHTLDQPVELLAFASPAR
jgi:hypothetical protein